MALLYDSSACCRRFNSVLDVADVPIAVGDNCRCWGTFGNSEASCSKSFAASAKADSASSNRPNGQTVNAR